jgi:hypothetical protein
MATLDEITKEKQRVSEALTRADAQHQKLAHQLGELEAAERVLERYGKGTQAVKTGSAKTPSPAKKAGVRVRRRGRRATVAAKPAGGQRGSSSLSDRVLALANGKTQQQITAACKSARPNHVGAALSRHKRAGRIEERDGKLFATHATQTEQRAV